MAGSSAPWGHSASAERTGRMSSPGGSCSSNVASCHCRKTQYSEYKRFEGASPLPMCSRRLPGGSMGVR